MQPDVTHTDIKRIGEARHWRALSLSQYMSIDFVLYEDKIQNVVPTFGAYFCIDVIYYLAGFRFPDAEVRAFHANYEPVAFTRTLL